MRVYYDADADLNLIKNKRVARNLEDNRRAVRGLHRLAALSSDLPG
jgi:hypothetical protein